MIYNFTAEIIHDKEINQFIGFVSRLPGAHSQASTLDKLHKNLEEVIHLCLEEMTDDEKTAIIIS
ncbi:MAG TPA: type II toxin-antitoxin system HicB family antitoxin [Prolixibacteraceae bacterium]|nr:type II toxin-antitoxin system HicB family antitoxin [Prolixibacteraceae bacterium]